MRKTINYIEDMKRYKKILQSEKVVSYINNIVDEIKKYDVYDIIARISCLNLVPENQNKSTLLDALITAILKEEENKYQSNYKMSSGKFRKVIEELNDCLISSYIDPNENLYVQNVMLMDNYKMFNGIDYTPTYNLQMLIDILFGYQNDFPEEFLRDSGKLINFVLGVSDELAKKIDVDECRVVLDEGKKVLVPDNGIISEYSKYVVFKAEKIEMFFGNSIEAIDILAEFGNGDWGSIDNRPFYSKPFVRNTRDNTIVLLNPALLATFAFYKVLNIASGYNIMDKVIDRYNEYVWRDCKISLKELGHYKIKEDSIGIKLENRGYYKELLASVYNNQVMLVVFACDDAFNYTDKTMHSNYPDERHTVVFEERMKYFCEKLSVERQNVFCLIILSGFGRGMGLRTVELPTSYKAIKLNPFELKCIKINESKTENFIPRYIRSKNKINFAVPNLFSELDTINWYTDNKYSFYINDDFNPNECTVYTDSGEGVYYINRALQKSNERLIESYREGWKVRVKSCDKIRNMYMEVENLESNKSSICICYSNCVLWITSEQITDELDLNLHLSIIDALSFWLAECKDIIDEMDLIDNLYHFNIVLDGEKKTYYYENDADLDLLEAIKVHGSGKHYDLIWSPEAYRQMTCKTNKKEYELCKLVLQILNKNTYEPINYEKELKQIFINPMKKKFFAFDYESTPYLKPITIINERKIRREDEEELLDIIGKSVLNKGKWDYGMIPDSDRCQVTNDIVGMLYEMLQKEVERLNPMNLVEAIYLDLEDVVYKVMVGGMRYASDIACYPEKEGEYLQEYNNLNRVSMALKFLMEYVAATPPKGTEVLGIGRYEYILAICSMIIEWAYNNDLFRYNIFNTPISILRSGRIGMKQDEFINMFQYNGKYRHEQLFFNSSADFRKTYTIHQEDYIDELNEGFSSAFGYTFEQFCKVILCIIQYGNDDENTEIFIKDEDLLIKIVKECEEGLTEEIVEKVIEDMTLSCREDFLIPPSKYRKEDVYPWRFNRAYSFNRRPLIKRENDIIWGNRQLYHTLLYITDLLYDGRFKTKDKKLSSLIGKISDDRGKLFNGLIVNMLNDMKAFKVYSNVKRVNKKGISDEEGKTLGDIDVLIIDEKEHNIYVAEVKDFNFSRNPYEMQQEYEKMFVDDKKKCFVTKHKRRVQWIKEHISDVKMQYDLQDVNWCVKGIFITNEPLISNRIYGQNIEIISKAELSANRLRKVR